MISLECGTHSCHRSLYPAALLRLGVPAQRLTSKFKANLYLVHRNFSVRLIAEYSMKMWEQFINELFNFIFKKCKTHQVFQIIKLNFKGNDKQLNNFIGV